MVGLYVTHSYTLQYLHIMHINISKTVYRISFDKYIYASVTYWGKTANKSKYKYNTQKNFIFFYTTILFLSPLYTTLYTTRTSIAIAIVEVMPRGRVIMYSNTNKHFSSNLR